VRGRFLVKEEKYLNCTPEKKFFRQKKEKENLQTQPWGCTKKNLVCTYIQTTTFVSQLFEPWNKQFSFTKDMRAPLLPDRYSPIKTRAPHILVPSQ
jgi:hypothetical protein